LSSKCKLEHFTSCGHYVGEVEDAAVCKNRCAKKLYRLAAVVLTLWLRLSLFFCGQWTLSHRHLSIKTGRATTILHTHTLHTLLHTRSA